MQIFVSLEFPNFAYGFYLILCSIRAVFGLESPAEFGKDTSSGSDVFTENFSNNTILLLYIFWKLWKQGAIKCAFSGCNIVRIW